jgi:hypothetical protein
MAAGTYTTLYQAGGSGSNYVPDGYIKTVEKVWLDSYTIAFTNTNTTIDIAVIPANKKIVGIDLMIATSAAQSSGTISIGFSTDANIDAFLNPTSITHNLTLTTISLFGKGISTQNLTTAEQFGKIGGFQLVTAGTQSTISVKLNNWTMTTGTMKTIVRYT